ncbi:MAG: TonB-dependent receptor plug domain-containing protein [Candidatus Latescibacterota bacterium]|nr:TonB-dependent receptor plug domain-containing protein [Candidatus Latescibacterota bacterium]
MRRPSTQTRSRSRVGLFFIALLLALQPEALLAGGLQGRLFDGDTPVSGAVLTLHSASGAIHAARSDADGAFQLQDLPPGAYELRVEMLGYRPLERRVQIGASHGDAAPPTEIELTLKPLPLLMDEMVVRARRDPKGGHTAAFVEAIDFDDQRAPDADLAQTLDRATGVNIRRYGGLGSFSALSIRGSTAEQVQVFLDGVPLNQAIGGGVDLGSLPIGGVESIEIYRGAVPARFGGNSLGGVVHIRTRPLGDEVRTRLRTGTGSFGTRQLSASIGGPWNGWEYLGLVDYRASRNDFRFWDDNGTEYNANDDGWARRLNSDFRGLRGLAKVGRRLGAGRLQIHNTVDLSHKGIPGIGNNQSLHTRYDTWRNIAEATLFGPLGQGRAGYRLKAYHSREISEYKDLRGEVGIGTQHNRSTTWGMGLRGELNALLPGRALLTGFAATRREIFDPNDLLQRQSGLPHSRRRGLAAGTEMEVPLMRRLTLNVGAQLERLDDRFFARQAFAPDGDLPGRDHAEILWGYRLGAALDLGAGLTLKAHDGRYRRAPNFFELFGDRGAVVGNVELVSERGRNCDLGLVFRNAPKGTGLILAEAVYYRNRVDDLIRFAQNSQRVSRPDNVGRAALRGVETRVQTRLLSALEIGGNYIYQRAENRTPFSFERGNDLPNAPRHRFNARIALDLVRVGVHCEFSRESRHFLDRANLRTVPVRVLHHLGGRVPLVEGVALSWALRNLSDNRVADLWGYPLPGRSYALAMHYIIH